MLAALPAAVVPPPQDDPPQGSGCEWWNLVCQGGEQVADSGLAAITHAMINGLVSLFGQITKIVDESTRVPLADTGYRDTYYGFARLAVPLIAVVFFLALISAAVRRDPRALARATVGIGVAGIGGAVYVIFAQFLVALDDWLAHGVVSVTGADFGNEMADLTDKFKVMGAAGPLAADALMLGLMGISLVAGIFLWIVLLLRKIAILVVVAFAPLLIVGWMWPPTRSWSRRATEVLIALVFSKSVIYMIFGIGMSMLFRSHQSLSDFVGAVVLLCGACFAPIVMLRLVHFAADSHLAGDMFGNLSAGASPTLNRVAGIPSGVHRHRMADDYASNADRGRATTSIGGPRPGTEGGPIPDGPGDGGNRAKVADGAGGGGDVGAPGSAPGAAGPPSAASTASPEVAAVVLAAVAAQKAAQAARKAGGSATDGASALGGEQTGAANPSGAAGPSGPGGPTAPPASPDGEE